MKMVVQSCTYYDAVEKIEWKLILEQENAIMQKILKEKKTFTHHGEKKKVPKEYIMNLDIVFSDDFWKEGEKIAISDNEENVEKMVLVSEDKEMIYHNYTDSLQKVKEMFQTIKLYFQLYWQETVKPITLSFHSFDGGGPQFSLNIEKKGIFTWYSQKHYFKEDHEQLCGAGYDVEYTLYPLRMGTATAKLIGDSPICPQPPKKLTVKVDEKFHMEYKMEEYSRDFENESEL